MKCSNCGFVNRKTIRFCENCGNELQVKAAKTSAVRKNINCPSCGELNSVGLKFCQNCGQALSQNSQPSVLPRTVRHDQRSRDTLTKWVARGIVLFLASFLITYVALNVSGYANLLSPLSGNKLNEAEIMAQTYVEKYYPFLANADRTVYTATLDGKDFYVVDFENNDPNQPPMGARILVDRVFRFVVAYEVVDGR